MKSRICLLAIMTVFTIMVATPAHVHGVQTATPADQHADHHPGQPDSPPTATVPELPGSMMASMMASNAKLDLLVKKMNTATGAAKTDAIAELLTAIVQEHQTMHGAMMSNMMQMMNMMGGMGGRGDAGPMMPRK